MADEAILKVRKSDPINFKVADATGIEKGTLLKLTDPRTAAASDGANVFAGIAEREKIANDGRTQLAVYTDGIFDLYATSGAAITAGELVKLSGANWITGGVVEADIVAGKVVGKALESTSAGTAETIEVAVGAV